MSVAVESVNSNQIPCVSLPLIFFAVGKTCHKYTKSSTETELPRKFLCVWTMECERSVNHIESSTSQYNLATSPFVSCQKVHFQQSTAWPRRFQHLAIRLHQLQSFLKGP